MKLLISEDNPAVQKLLEKTLAKTDYEVICTSNGAEAYEILKLSNGPQIALIDWMMPVMDGLTLCRKLRQEGNRHPLYLLLITSKDKTGDIITGLEAGADDYIKKPFEFEELYARINVGRRIIDMQNESLNRQKLDGVLEMAGAVCHEMNQPLQAILTGSELLLYNLPEDDPNHNRLKTIHDAVQRIGALTRKMMSISSYSAKSHLDGRRRIIDLENSSSNI